MSDVLDFARTRKFWTAVAGGLVTFLSIAFDSPTWISGLTITLTALGVYQSPNKR